MPSEDADNMGLLSHKLRMLKGEVKPWIKQKSAEMEKESLSLDEDIRSLLRSTSSGILTQDKQKTLNEIDEYVSKVIGMKEGIENSFAQQLELLLMIRGKQESTLQKLQTRAEQLFNKRKNIETNAYKAILERNVIEPILKF